MVSVCLATYNGEKYILEQIDSILKQIGVDDELVISDDQSTDNTRNILQSICEKDKRVQVYIHTKERCRYAIDYATHNFENAILKSRGDIIFLSDQDDIWLPGKYTKMLNSLQHSDIVVSGFTVVDQERNILIPLYKPKRGYWRNLINNTNNGCCMAFNRCILQKILPFPKSMVGHDFWIGVYGGLLFKKDYIDEPLLLYRRHVGNVTPGNSKSTLPVSFKIKYRMVSLWCTIKGLFNCILG